LKTVEAFKARINERERRPQGEKLIRQEIHGELVHEIAVGVPLVDGPSVTLRR